MAILFENRKANTTNFFGKVLDKLVSVELCASLRENSFALFA